MLVLKDGTTIYDEWGLREVLEPVGFDCWRIQKPDLCHILSSGGTIGDDPIVELAEMTRELESALCEKENTEDELDDACCQIEELESDLAMERKDSERKSRQIQFLIEKLRQAGIDPYMREDGSGIESVMEELARQEKDALCTHKR